ncbi:MAG: CehA/McbA family metallohydrolase [Bacteroidota bacterium]|nr:CehA/McbA family metallohydrolase [Bacteroidota bacterium]
MQKNTLLILISLILIFTGFTIAQTPAYNFYFGNIHSHTWYSDGNKDKTPASYLAPVAKAMEYGRTVANNLNFLAVTDHNHNESLNMTLAYWRSGVIEADTANKDGIFVGLYGQEWGTLATNGGHALIFGTNKLIGWNPGVYDIYVAKNDYSTSSAGLWRRVSMENGFIYLAHPSSSDFNNLIASPFNTLIDSVLKGVALKSGPAFSTNTTQTDPSSSTYESYYHSLLKLGYHVAPSSDQDNHYTNFGMSNQQRTVVVAPSLTKSEILNALRNRRVYASEDNNIQVRFEVGTNLLGDIFSAAPPFGIKVKVSDATPGDVVSKIEIRYGVPGSGAVPTVLATVSGRDSLVTTVTQPLGSTYYYYVYVQQVDGHRVWTAPMWITAKEDQLPVTFGSFAATLNLTGEGIKLEWSTLTEKNNYGFYVQRKKASDINFQTINSEVIPGVGEPHAYSYFDSTIVDAGEYEYRILQVDNDSLQHYSSTEKISFTPTAVFENSGLPLKYKLSQNYPNPFNPVTNIQYQVPEYSFVSLQVFDIFGREVQALVNGYIQPGYYQVEFDGSNLASGIYYYQLKTPNSSRLMGKMILLK